MEIVKFPLNKKNLVFESGHCKISIKSPERIKKNNNKQYKSYHVLTVNVGDRIKKWETSHVWVLFVYTNKRTIM